MFQVVRTWISHWLAIFLKTYNPENHRRPSRYSEPNDLDVPKFIDRFEERNADRFEEHEKIKQAVADAKASLGIKD